MDIFVEKIVARKKTTQDFLITFGIIFGSFVACVAAFVVPVLNMVAPVLMVAVLYFGFYFSKSRNIEFEYAVTNGDLDIDKIIAQRKRKRIYSAASKDIEIVAKLKSDKYTPEYQNIKNRIEAVSSMEESDVYFVVSTYNGARTIVFFQPDNRMIDSFKTKISRKVFEW